MGGKGTYATGNNVAYTYKTVDKIEGAKVLVGIYGKHDLPMESHSKNTIYIKVNRDGTFRTLRTYGEDHLVNLEIAYHREASIDKHAKAVLHYHTYQYEKNLKGGMDRSDAFPIKDWMIKKYGKFLKGIKL